MMSIPNTTPNVVIESRAAFGFAVDTPNTPRQ